jgi:monooxygenase
MNPSKTSNLDYDVIIVGAGLSGIGTAYHLQNKCPQLTYKILEGRESIGGTWDLFKYPGIRSDSDMYTFGFAFNPWKNSKSISDGQSIMDYMHQTIEDFKIKDKIQLNTKVVSADWSSEEAAWTLNLKKGDSSEKETIKCRFMIACTGYYNYENGYRPTFANEEAFGGTIVHPQHWDTSLDYSNKKIIIIGSGATAVTLVPELAKKAQKVTMLQRSPTYIINLPNKDIIAEFLKAILPANTAHNLVRWKNILFGVLYYKACRKWPNTMKKLILGYTKKYLGDKYDEKHFSPYYNPWDQRMCVVPDNDLFDAIKQDKADIVTDTIEKFTEKGIQLKSGQHLDADIIVTATGLALQLFGGATVQKDGSPVEITQTHVYRGAMLSGVPNAVIAFGYTNASWTLKVDLLGHFTTRLLNYMSQKGYTVCQPAFDTQEFNTERLLDFDAGYILRGQHIMPKQGSQAPWRVFENYLKDVPLIKKANLEDGYLKYS